MKLENNIKNTALIFEGGGMRGSYTAGMLNVMLENELYFDYVAGISAGSSHSVNYLSRDQIRAKSAFVDFVLDPNFGGWRSFFKGEGYFKSKYLYEVTPLPDAKFPFDFETFMANPATLKVGAFDRDSGELRYHSKEDVKTLQDLMLIVRSSSSMPIFMPETTFKNHVYVDGGLGGGVALDIAKKDGMEKFFVMLTRPKGYRKSPMKYSNIIRMYYRKYPHVIEAMMNRHILYNQTLEELETLEREGKAFLVYPESMPVSSRETNYQKLNESYKLGYAQGLIDLPKWKEFLK